MGIYTNKVRAEVNEQTIRLIFSDERAASTVAPEIGLEPEVVVGEFVMLKDNFLEFARLFERIKKDLEQ
jgi:hypothetical protein